LLGLYFAEGLKPFLLLIFVFVGAFPIFLAKIALLVLVTYLAVGGGSTSVVQGHKIYFIFSISLIFLSIAIMIFASCGHSSL
jgi:hypothetical protein